MGCAPSLADSVFQCISVDVIQIYSDHIGRLGGFDDVDVKRIPGAGMDLRLVKKFGSPE